MKRVKNLGLDLQKLLCEVSSIFIETMVPILFLYDHIFLLKKYMQRVITVHTFRDEISQAESRKDYIFAREYKVHQQFVLIKRNHSYWQIKERDLVQRQKFPFLFCSFNWSICTFTPNCKHCSIVCIISERCPFFFIINIKCFLKNQNNCKI